ncbi:MAG: hypothetical protein IJZ10_11700 [Thermoguttaceae bacterium]|nr:hypothetical protein [Thermoguttaceae bacterium]
MKEIFLSASVPFGERAQKYAPDAIAVQEALNALVATVTPYAKLVFGGHPAVTPFIWRAAKSLETANNVVIYQSNYYRDKVPQEALYFENIEWTRVVNEGNIPSASKSLALMRNEMLSRAKIAAGIFIGGMDGVEEEWELFGKIHRDKPRYPIASTEGAAKLIWKNTPKSMLGSLKIDYQKLNDELCYPALFSEILSELSPRDAWSLKVK